MAKTQDSLQMKSLINKHPLQRLNSPSRGVSALVHVRLPVKHATRSRTDCVGLVSWSLQFRRLVSTVRSVPQEVEAQDLLHLLTTCSLIQYPNLMYVSAVFDFRYFQKPLRFHFRVISIRLNLLADSDHLTRNASYGWHFQYLTIIGLALATTTFTLGFLADITLSPRLFLAKNILSVCSAPLECLVSTLYWGLWAIDPALVVPKELELPLLPGMWRSL